MLEFNDIKDLLDVVRQDRRQSIQNSLLPPVHHSTLVLYINNFKIQEPFLHHAVEHGKSE
jgi:hypothetical protein